MSLSSFYPLIRAGLFKMEPEDAHAASISALKLGLAPACGMTPHPCLRVNVAGLNFANPLGMAAGYDKNAEAAVGVFKMGFGAVEVGTITPLPQAGNPKPRVFRLIDDEALINRLGFNNHGLEVVCARIAAEKKNYKGVLGINIGANKDSADRINDYVIGARAMLPLADYLTINISSPNTPGLRDLQGVQFLDDLLARVLDVRAAGASSTPIFLKIAPDMALADVDDVLRIAQSRGIDGLIVSNTTIARPDTLKSPNTAQTGGLSGAPLFAPSTAMLAQCYTRLEGKLPLIGVGGILSGRDALAKIQAGASLIQLYTGLIYKGPALVGDILDTLAQHCQRNGYASIAQAVGKDVAAHAQAL